MEFPINTFNEIIESINSFAPKRKIISYKISKETLDDNSIEHTMVISKEGIDLVIIKEKYLPRNSESTKIVDAMLQTRIFKKAIKTIFLNGLDSFKAIIERKKEEDIDTLWDKHSEHIGEDIDSLQSIAGTSIMKKQEFKKSLSYTDTCG